MKRLLSISAVGSLLTALLFMTAQPAWAGVDERIQALEQELSQLKAEQEQLKGEQMELRKEATTAAAKMPTFSYRGGSGILMQAADKSWSLRFRFRFHGWLLFRDGKSHVRGGQGEYFGRRIRPTFYYCLNNCFYEIEYALDEDGFFSDSKIQRGTAFIHFEKMSPWAPTFYFGIDAPTDWARRRSSSSEASMLDYDMLSRNNGGNTFSQTWTLGLLWEDLPLGSIGIPGQIGWFNFTVGAGPATSGEGQGRFSDRKDFVTSIGIEPFSETKSKWINGLEYSFGVWFCNRDHNDRTFTNVAGEEEGPEGCNEARIRETDGPERANIWRHDIRDDRNMMNHFLMNSIRWRVGVYQLLATLGFARYEQTPVRHRNWAIAHDLFIWSPKGFLTGSASTPNSIRVGWHFQRSDAHCRVDFCDNDDEYQSNHAILRGLGLFWFIQRGISTGVVWNWYDAKKLTTGVQEDLDCRSTPVAGRGCDWHNVFLVWRWEF